MKKKIFMVIALLIAFIFIMPTNANAATAACPKALSVVDSIKAMHKKTGTNLGSVKGVQETAIPAAYHFGFGRVKANTKVTYKNAMAASKKSSILKAWANSKETSAKALTYKAISDANVSASELKNGYSVCYAKIGFYNDNYIDVKGEVTGFSKSGYNGYKKLTPIIAFNSGKLKDNSIIGRPGIEVMGANWVKVKWSFHKSKGDCSGAAVTVKGNTTYWDVDVQQGVANIAKTSKGVAIPTTKYVSSKKNNKLKLASFQTSSCTQWTYVYAKENKDQAATNSNYAFTETFSGSSIERIYTFYRAATGKAYGGITHDYKPVKPVTPPNPTKSVNVKNVTESTKFEYRVKQKVPLQDTNNYHHTSFIIEDKLNDAIDMSGITASTVKVIRQDGGAVVSGSGKYFTISVSGNTVKATATAAALKSEAFYGETYELVIPAKIKANYDFAAKGYKKDSAGNFIIPNSGSTKINGVNRNTNTVEIYKAPPAPIEDTANKSYAEDTEAGSEGSPVSEGDKIKYEINYANGDKNNSANVVVTDILSTGLEFIDSDSSYSLKPTSVTKNSDGTTTIKWNTTLEKGASGKITYEVKVVPGYINKVNNNANVTIGNRSHDLKTLENPILKVGKVIVRYLEDGTNKELADEAQLEGNYGDPYNTEKKDIEGYTFVKSTDNTSGTINQDETVVVYYYKSNIANLIVHHYIKGTTTKVAEDETKELKYNDSYTTSKKDIPNYEYDSTAGDPASGTASKDTIEVIYYYKQKAAQVITKYLEKGTNKELHESTVKGYKYGDPYATESLDIENYNFDSISGDKSGVVDKDTIEVIYYYVKKDSKIDDKIEKTGTDKLKSSNDIANYTITYNAKLTDYKGNAVVTIIDKLPAKINKDKSDFDGGVYNESSNTITWTQEFDNYNSNSDSPISITKNIKISYANLVGNEKLVNEVSGTIKLDNNESKVTNEKITDVEIPGTVIVKYVDENNKEIESKETNTGLVGKDVSLFAKDIKGYILIKKPESELVKIKEGTTEYVYVYQRIKVNIITKALTEGGVIIGDEIVEYGNDEQNQVIMRADTGYVIKKVTINKKEYKIKAGLTDLKIPKFNNMKEDKIIEVSFEPAKVAKVKQKDVSLPNTDSNIALITIISGIVLLIGGGYFVCYKYKINPLDIINRK